MVRTRGRRLALALLGAGLGLLALEIGLRLFWTPARRAYVWPPGLDTVFAPDPTILPGVSGPARFHIGSHGLRASEVPDRVSLRIVTVGGSTTECLFLDQTEAWPALLEARLNEEHGFGSAWVGNAGRSGHTTREHRLQVEELRASLPALGVVIVIAGINDLGRRLAHERDYDPLYLERPGALARLRRASFSLLPVGEDADGPLPERFSLARALKLAKLRLYAGRPRADNFDVRLYGAWRRNRAGARELREELPDLEPALAEFASNVRAIVASVRACGGTVVFATQPVLWRPQLAPALEVLLWMGGVDDFQKRPGCAYYSTAALARGMQAYNRVLSQTCIEEGVACLDLASRMDGRDECFCDDCHFNEAGAHVVAAAFAEFLASRGLAPKAADPGAPQGER